MRGIIALLLLIPIAATANSITMGTGFIPPAPKVMNNIGSGELRDYFFRYWNAEGKRAAMPWSTTKIPSTPSNDLSVCSTITAVK